MKRSSPTRSHFLAALCLVGLGAATALAQIGGLGGLSDKLTGKNPLSKLLAGKPPITTSLEDARWADASKDNFTPREAARALLTLQRTPNGGSSNRAARNASSSHRAAATYEDAETLIEA